jgi:uncharacterized protein YecT (DUF1311 family)
MKIGFWQFASLTVGLLMFSTSVPAQTHRQKGDPCKDTSYMSQREMNECASKQLQRTEAKLEGLLRRVGLDRDSPEQKAWEAYRDAQLAALYPPEDISGYGSVYPMCFAILKTS